MSLDKLLKDRQIVAVLCNQWGDSGKGKIVDLLADRTDIIARGTGGNNAGHTVIINGKERVYHTLPCGITYDSQGKINVLGNGMVLSIGALCEELDDLKKAGGSYDNLMISQDAHVILQFHGIADRKKEQARFGTTGKGIGPCYADKVARRGIKVGDLFETDILVRKLRDLASYYPYVEYNVSHDVHYLQERAERVKPFVRDTVKEMQQARRSGKRILLEGAQGLLLSIEHGTYPHVTSSDCSLNGTASGVGLSARDVDLTLGLMKFPFMTRVGRGPFPTELGGAVSEEYCNQVENRRRSELIAWRIPFTENESDISYDPQHQQIKEMINDEDPNIQGIGIRLAADEYGATTGRPRRVGWTDIVAGKYAAHFNGKVIVLTKPDALAGIRQFKLCFGYNHNNTSTTDFNREERFLRETSPWYKTYEGYGDIREVRAYERLPESLQKAIGDLEHAIDGHVAAVSVGPEREQTIMR